MKAFVIYDSVFGNTEKIARAIAEGIDPVGEVPVTQVSQVKPADLTGLDYLFVGSPTRGFKPTPAIMEFLTSLPTNSLSKVRAAAFDTRIPLETIKNPIFRAIVRRGGYADKPIAVELERKGAILSIPSGGFFVLASEGPLQEGELERARQWAKTILVP